MRSLTGKLTLAFLVVGLTGAALVAAFVGLRTRAEFNRFVLDRYQSDTVAVLADYYEQNDGWSGLALIVPRGPFGRRGAREGIRPPLVVADAAGIVVLGGQRLRVGETLGPEALAQAVPIEVDGQVVGRVLFPAPNGRPGWPAEADFLARFNRAILLGALGATVVALLLGVLLARTITRPLRALTAATEQVAQGRFGHTVEVSARDELGELVTAFNQMSVDLDRASRSRRQMTADIAHDLRTPVAVLLGYTEGLVDGKFQGIPPIYTSMHEEALHLKMLIDDLRLVSLADSGELALQRQPTPPLALLDRAAMAHGPLAEARGVALRVAGGAASHEAGDTPGETVLPEVDVDPERMAQVLGNLVGNALRHTPPGGEITLSADAAEGSVRLRVADNGEGIAPEDLPFIFARHYRADTSRRDEGDGAGATGLGLAIAQSLVEAHGGTIGAESALGAGTTVTITLPVARLTDAAPVQRLS